MKYTRREIEYILDKIPNTCTQKGSEVQQLRNKLHLNLKEIEKTEKIMETIYE